MLVVIEPVPKVNVPLIVIDPAPVVIKETLDPVTV
jgi:hypothetical protein